MRKYGKYCGWVSEMLLLGGSKKRSFCGIGSSKTTTSLVTQVILLQSKFNSRRLGGFHYHGQGGAWRDRPGARELKVNLQSLDIRWRMLTISIVATLSG